MIKSDARFNNAILKGDKTTTVRLDNRWYPGEIHAVFNPEYRQPVAWIKIKQIWTDYRLGNVAIIGEGFIHHDDLIAFLQRTYPGKVFDYETKVNLIEFELTEAPNELP